MANINNRKLPAGIQSFRVIREQGYLHVDKTDIIWNLANHGNKYNYLSRPRRFGKSVLVDTPQMHLEGRKELFLYQSSYLTIKECDEFGYILGFPNEEVKQALYEIRPRKRTLRLGKGGIRNSVS